MRRAVALLVLLSACGRPNPPEAIPSRPPAGQKSPEVVPERVDAGLVEAPPDLRFAEVPATTRQVVWVGTEGWGSREGVMSRHERDAGGALWRQVGEAAPVMVGRGGLGWGRGLHRARGRGDPLKVEGDGRAPAGVFRLSRVFGLAPSAPVVRMPYTPIVSGLECVDDPGSKHYNRLVLRDSVGVVDWESAERMSKMGSVYRWGLFVDHNVDPPQPGGGSCIFMHVWAGPGVDTVGCTSMALEAMEVLLGWLDPEAEPVLVQRPLQGRR